MNRGGFKMQPERAKAIGRMLFQKYDISKRGVLEPKQCYEVFSDFCYRILVLHLRHRILAVLLPWSRLIPCTRFLMPIGIRESLSKILRILPFAIYAAREIQVLAMRPALPLRSQSPGKYQTDVDNQGYKHNSSPREDLL